MQQLSGISCLVRLLLSRSVAGEKSCTQQLLTRLSLRVFCNPQKLIFRELIRDAVYILAECGSDVPSEL